MGKKGKGGEIGCEAFSCWVFRTSAFKDTCGYVRYDVMLPLDFLELTLFLIFV